MWKDQSGCTAYLFIFDPIPEQLHAYLPKFNLLQYCVEIAVILFVTIFSYRTWSSANKDPMITGSGGCTIFLIGVICLWSIGIIGAVTLTAILHPSQPFTSCPDYTGTTP
jgi:hypothetical protein